jgi:hypothetical protein
VATGPRVRPRSSSRANVMIATEATALATVEPIATAEPDSGRCTPVAPTASITSLSPINSVSSQARPAKSALIRDELSPRNASVTQCRAYTRREAISSWPNARGRRSGIGSTGRHLVSPAGTATTSIPSSPSAIAPVRSSVARSIACEASATAQQNAVVTAGPMSAPPGSCALDWRIPSILLKGRSHCVFVIGPCGPMLKPSS